MISMRHDLRDDAGKLIWNIYHCKQCTADGIDHSVGEVSAGLSDARCQWGSGIPMTKYECTSCGATRGPFVSTAHTGDGW